MRQYSSDIAFTPSVKAIQTAKGSRYNYERMELGGGWETAVTPDLESFLADLDMFYLGTANAVGQPYIQYRGGSPGFLKVIDEKTLGFADFGGNRQYITLGAGLKYQVLTIDMSYLISTTQNNPLANTLRFTLRFTLDDDAKSDEDANTAE